MVNEKLLSLSVEIIILILITKTQYFRKKTGNFLSEIWEISSLRSLFHKTEHLFFPQVHRFQQENMSLLYWIQTSVLATRVNQEAADKAHCRSPHQQRSTAQCTQVTGSAIKYRTTLKYGIFFPRLFLPIMRKKLF